MKLSTSRVVAFLTPVFAAGAALGTPALVKLGFHITPQQVTDLAITGAGSVVAIAAKWLHGLSLWERAEQAVKHDVQAAEAWTEQHIAPADVQKIVDAVKAVAPNVEQIATDAADQARAKLVAVITGAAPVVIPAEAPVDPPAAA